MSDAWGPLRDGVAAPPAAGRLAELDALAEGLLLQADQLTRQLETAGLVTTLHVINLSGRQRMLSQRHAKSALLGLLLPAEAAAAAEAERMKSAAELEQAMAALKALPLSTPEIRGLLDEAEGHWARRCAPPGRPARAAACAASTRRARRCSRPSSSSPTATSAACRC